MGNIHTLSLRVACAPLCLFSSVCHTYLHLRTDVLVYSSPLCLRAAECIDERRRRNAPAVRWWSCCCREGMRLHLLCFLVINPLAIFSKQAQFVFWPDAEMYPFKSKLVLRCFRTGDKGQTGLSEDLTWVHVSNGGGRGGAEMETNPV